MLHFPGRYILIESVIFLIPIRLVSESLMWDASK